MAGDGANVPLSAVVKEVKLNTDGEPTVNEGAPELQDGEVGSQEDAVGPPTKEEFVKGNGGRVGEEGETGTPVTWRDMLPPVPVCPKTDVVLGRGKGAVDGPGVKRLRPDPSADVSEIPSVAVAPVAAVALGKGNGAPVSERGRPVEVSLSIADAVNALSVPVGPQVHVVFERW